MRPANFFSNIQLSNVRVCSAMTDTIPAEQDEAAMAEVVKLAQWLMEEV